MTPGRMPEERLPPERVQVVPEVVAGPGTVTVICGLSFAISDERGDVWQGARGLIVRDTRHLSLLELRVGGERVQHLGAGVITPDRARFHGYLAPREMGGPDALIEVERVRRIEADGALEDVITIESWADVPTPLDVEVRFGADFADIFEVRRVDCPTCDAPVLVSPHDGGVRITSEDGGAATTLRFAPVPDEMLPGTARWTARVRRGAPWRLRLRAETPAAHAGRDVPAPPAVRPAPSPPYVVSVPGLLERAYRRSLADLAALEIPDPGAPGRRLVAAGIPWFVALFGRDSIITSLQLRAVDPALMAETLHALAARQGSRDDAGNEEAPGKILHEVRLTRRPWLGEGTASGARPYYGSVDATPLFLILLGQAWRWGMPLPEVRALLPAARRALAWVRGPGGDPDGDGLLEYASRGARTLANQAWKDSENAVQFPDGRLASGPLALVEVQGYAYRARREMAAVLAALGDETEAAALDREADALRQEIRRRFWVEGRDGGPGFFALALDGEKRPVDSVASNMAHLLWCGVPSNEEAEQVARHLVSPRMASGWGLRTLSSAMGGYNPISYHVGSVWPHDTAIACEGLRRYGHDAEAMALVGGLLSALAVFEERLPELFGGHAQSEVDFPVPYPTACRPQAWAAGVPPAFVPLLLGLEADIPGGLVSIDPRLPDGVRSLEVRGIPFPTGRLSVAISREDARLMSVPPGVRVELRARPDPGPEP